jgi:pimeloyl-ACP methyl ester carboxylesterase
VTNGLACEREVIVFDNAGVGSSTGDTPPMVAAMTKDCVDFCRALDLMSFDVMGFSLGGHDRAAIGAGSSGHDPADDPAGRGTGGRRRHDRH